MTDFLLGISYGLVLLCLDLLVGEFLLLPLPLLDNEETLLDLLVPELFDVLLLVILNVLQVRRHLVQEKSSIVLVTISHVLLVVGMLEELELAVHERTSCEVECQRWFVRLVKEVPNIDTVSLCDKDNTWSCWRESTACIMSSVGWS